MDPRDFTALDADRAREAAAHEARRRALVGQQVAHLAHRVMTAGPSDQGEATDAMRRRAQTLHELVNRDPTTHANDLVTYRDEQDAAADAVLDIMDWAHEDPDKTTLRPVHLTTYDRRRTAHDFTRKKIFGRAKTDSQVKAGGGKLRGISTAVRVQGKGINYYENRSAQMIGLGEVDPANPAEHAYVEFFIEEGMETGRIPKRVVRKGGSLDSIDRHGSGFIDHCGVRMYIGDAHGTPDSMRQVGVFDVKMLDQSQRNMIDDYTGASTPAERQAAMTKLFTVDPQPDAPNELAQLQDAILMVHDAVSSGTAWVVP